MACDISIILLSAISTYCIGKSTHDAFQANSNINAAPNVPVSQLAANNPALFFGCPFGSKPIMRPAPKIVGIMQRSITDDRSCHLSDK
jgi:hypothetical protein